MSKDWKSLQAYYAARVLAHLETRPMTSDEITALEGMDCCSIASAVADLKRRGQVRPHLVDGTPAYRPTRCGNPAQVWERGSGGDVRPYTHTQPMPWPISKMHEPIRQFVERHGGATAREIAAGTKYMVHTVRPQLLYLVRNGVLVCQRQRPYRYSVAA